MPRYRKILWLDQRGSVAIIFGVVAPVLIGFTGLAVDGSKWLVARAKLRGATDSAAIAAARALQLDGDEANLTGTATKLFGLYYGDGAGDGATSVQFVAENPPSSGAYAGDSSAVAVIAGRTETTYFSKIFGYQSVEVTARAVARVSALSEACVLGLSPTKSRTVAITGSASVDINCGLASNSSSSQALYVAGSAQVKASGASTVGDIYTSNGIDLETNGGPMQSHAPPLPDPYGPEGRNLQVPSSPKACTERKLRVKGNQVLSPGRYCSGIDFQSGTATLQSGTYIIDGGTLSIGAQASVIGDGVTFVLTGSGKDYAQLDVNGGAQISLHAPTSGTNADGVLIYQDANAPTFQGSQVISNKLNGGSNLDISGAIYFPSQGLDFSGGAGSTITCLQLVAFTVTITGNSKIVSTCPSNSGTEKLTRQSIELVE